MVTFHSSSSIRRQPTIRRNIFLCNMSIVWNWDLDINNTAIPNKSTGPTQASKYFNLKYRDTTWSNKANLCLYKNAQAARWRFWNSIFIRFEEEVGKRRPRYLWESSSPKILTKYLQISMKLIIDSSSYRMLRRIFVFLIFNVNSIFYKASINLSVMDINSFNDFA